MGDLRFDEQAVGAILHRAVEIQSETTPEVERQGLTLEELLNVAAEVGIDPASVEQATRELAARKPETLVSERPTWISLDRTVPGVLGEEAWDDFTQSLAQRVGSTGKTSVEGKTREWTTSSAGELATYTFTSTTRGGATRLRLSIDTSGGVLSFWVIGPVIGFISSLFIWTVMATHGWDHSSAMIVGILTFAASILVTNRFVRGWRRNLRRRANEMMEGASAIVTRSISRGPEE